ncbi:MAG: hypothetical protein PUD59_01445 [bacterium]|nr:hypothetical protein [bacterium]
MNKKNCIIYFIDFILVVLIIINLVNYINVKPSCKSIIINNQYNDYYLSSNYLEKKVDTVEDYAEVTEDISTEIVDKNYNNQVVTEKKQEVVEKKEIESKNNEKKETIVTDENEEKNNTSNNNYNVIETLIGKISGYGPDCYGCTSNKTSSGRYIGDGQIYYEDKTFGKVRIVSADKKYPYGTIVRIINYYDEEVYAIVLDRGGDIGTNKKFMFDLLFESEKEAIKKGSKSNVKFEILRLGY